MQYQLPEHIESHRKELRAFFTAEIEPLANQRDHLGPLTKDEFQKLIQRMRPSGYLTAPFPQELGGDNRTILERAVFGEEAARAWPALASSIDTHLGVAAAVFRTGPAWAQDKYLSSALNGSTIFCDMTSEPGAGSDTRNLTTEAVLDGDNYVVNGEKMWQTNGPWADVGVLTAVADASAHEKDPRSGIIQLLVDRSESEWEVRDLPLLGLRAGTTGHFVFRDMLVPKKNLLLDNTAGYAHNLKLRGWARVSLSAKALGVMQAALDDATEFAQNRVAFGKVLAGHQLIQAMIADMVVDLDASRMLTYRAAEMMDNGIRCDQEQAICKLFAVEAVKRVTDKAIQILGARGLTVHEGFRTERLYRDARAYSIAEGTTEILKLALARRILGVQAFS